jgi:hypothetical protein
MRKVFFAALAIFSFSSPVFADAPVVPARVTGVYTCTVNRYVDAVNGSDTNDGTGPDSAHAWATITKAKNVMTGYGNGGVCVNVAPGVYNNSYIYMQDQGGSADTPTGYLVFRSSVPKAAKITIPAGQFGNHIITAGQGTRYVIFDGFDVYASNAASITGAAAFAFGTSTDYTHHVKFLNMHVHDVGGQGIAGSSYVDYLDFRGNLVHDCAGYRTPQTSCMTIFAPVNSDGTTAVHNNVSGNVVYQSLNRQSGNHTEGTGFAADTFDSLGVYTAQTIIENNVVFHNGGVCMYAYKSRNVTLRFNTCYKTGLDTTLTALAHGELELVQANNCTVANNIVVMQDGPQTNDWGLDDDPQGQGETGNVWAYNIVWGATYDGATAQKTQLTRVTSGGADPAAGAGNLIGVNPKLVQGGIGYLYPGPGSPAKNAGTTAYGVPAADAAGVARGASPSIGALQ